MVPLRQIRVPHQVAIAFARGAAAFVDGPDDQALAAAAVAGGEDALDAGRVFLVLGLDVGARVGFHIDFLQQRLLRAEETHRQQDELRGASLFGAGLSFGMNWPLSFFSHSISHGARAPCTLPVVVADELLHGGEIDARIGAEFRGGFFLAVVQLVDLRPFRPRIVVGALHRRLRQDLDLHEALAAVAHRRADAVGAGVAAADDDDVLALRR